MSKYKNNCGVCKLCRGLTRQPICPICNSIKARKKPYGIYGTIYVECDNYHEYNMALQIDYDDIDTHQKTLDEKELQQ